MTPGVAFLLVLVIGIAAGLIFDRFLGPGWLSRQIAGSTRMLVTSSLVGIAGSFIGYHLAGLAALSPTLALVGAAVGAAVVLYAWRMVR